MSAGLEFQVNTFTDDSQDWASVVVLENGATVYTWESFGQDGDQSGIYGKIIQPDGTTSTGEFRINSHTPNDQQRVNVTALIGGGFVATWESAGQDTSNDGVFAQVYTSAGSPVGSEMQVNTYVDGAQRNASTAALANGNFVVTWESVGQDGDSGGIYGQLFAHDGAAIGGEFSVNTETVGGQSSPKVETLTDGSFVVGWNSFDQDGSGFGGFAQRFDIDANPVGAEFQVNSFTDSWQVLQSITSLTGGRFVMTWMSYGQDGFDQGVFGQMYNLDGTPHGDEFQVNTYAVNNQSKPQTVALEGGGFVVVWQSEGQDGQFAGVYGQLYAADGALVGGEFQVNSTWLGGQTNPEITALTDGGFVVVWESVEPVVGADGDIFAQQYNADGTVNGGEFQVNAHADGEQNKPHVVALPFGGFTVTWASMGQDGDASGVFSRSFYPDTVLGTVDRDNLVNGEGDDQMQGGAESDNLFGFGGDDRLEGNEGSDVLFGGNGNDWLYGNSGDDWVVGGAGNDRLFGGAGMDGFVFQHDGGLDIVYDFEDNIDKVVFLGGSFDDLIITPYHGTDADIRSVFGGRMVLRDVNVEDLTAEDFFFMPNPIQGTMADDTIHGTVLDDTIMGLAGSDRIYGHDGDDWIAGGAGAGIDRMWGGDGLDTFNFEWRGGLDIIYDFDVGQDLIYVDSGGYDDLYIFAYNDFDTEINSEAGGRLVIRGNESTDIGIGSFVFGDVPYQILATNASETVRGSGGDDIIDARNGNDAIVANAGNDVVTAGNGNDSAYGGHGNDVLLGGAGSDWLNGESGNDVLVGGTGLDRMWGGQGADVFQFEVGGGLDIVYDYVDGVDKIRIAVPFEDLNFSVYGANDAEIRTDAGGRMVLRNVDIADFTVDDFVFAV